MLIGGQAAEIHERNATTEKGGCAANGIGIGVIETRRGASDEAVVVPPVERNPRQILKRLILDVRGLLKPLVVVDAEGPDSSQISPQATDLRGEKARRNTAGCEKCRHPMKIRQAYPDRSPRNLGTVSSNREENGGVQEIAEVISVVCIFPKIVGINHEVLPEGLLKAGVKLVTLPGEDRSRRPK